VNGVSRAHTDSSGVYMLDNLGAGIYKITASKAGMVFADLEKYEILDSYETPSIPDISLFQVEVCGNVRMTSSSSMDSLTVKALQSGKPDNTIRVKKDGSFCQYLSPGQYVLRISGPAGVIFAPGSIPLTVADTPAYDIQFLEVLLSISGTVNCIGDCAKAEIKLTSKRITRNFILGQDTAQFTFSGLQPDEYKISVKRSGFCFEHNEEDIQLKFENIDSVTFTQSGFEMTIDSSVHYKLFYFLNGSTLNSKKSFSVIPGTNTFCLKKNDV